MGERAPEGFVNRDDRYLTTWDPQTDPTQLRLRSLRGFTTAWERTLAVPVPPGRSSASDVVQRAGDTVFVAAAIVSTRSC